MLQIVVGVKYAGPKRAMDFTFAYDDATGGQIRSPTRDVSKISKRDNQILQGITEKIIKLAHELDVRLPVLEVKQ